MVEKIRFVQFVGTCNADHRSDQSTSFQLLDMQSIADSIAEMIYARILFCVQQLNLQNAVLPIPMIKTPKIVKQ